MTIFQLKHMSNNMPKVTKIEIQQNRNISINSIHE